MGKRSTSFEKTVLTEPLTIVLPAHNEAHRIEPTLRAYRGAFADCELIVVVNGSTDDTAAVAKRLGAELPGVTVLEIPTAIGKGGAVKAGFGLARGTWVGFVDADLATAPAEFAKVVKAARGADGAVASRWVKGARVVGRTPLRSLFSRTFAALVRLLFGLPFRDTQCGAKVFHRRYLAAYLAASQVNDMAFDVELLWALHRAGARIVEVPTVWVAQPGSASLGSPWGFFRNGLRMLRSLWRVRTHAPHLEVVTNS